LARQSRVLCQDFDAVALPVEMDTNKIADSIRRGRKNRWPTPKEQRQQTLRHLLFGGHRREGDPRPAEHGTIGAAASIHNRVDPIGKSAQHNPG
jgi:hypothetical protein